MKCKTGLSRFWQKLSGRTVDPDTTEESTEEINILGLDNLPELPVNDFEPQDNLALYSNGTDICGYIPWTDKSFEILMKVTIPEGFKLKDDAEFVIELSIDQHTVKATDSQEERVVPVTIDRENESITMYCKMMVLKTLLLGDFYLNTVVSGFEARDYLTGDMETAFSGYGIVPVDMVLGYRCTDCGDYNPFADYTISIDKGMEFIMLPDGTPVYNGALSGADTRSVPTFYELLDGTETRDIFIPYTIIISPIASPES